MSLDACGIKQGQKLGSQQDLQKESASSWLPWENNAAKVYINSSALCSSMEKLYFPFHSSVPSSPISLFLTQDSNEKGVEFYFNTVVLSLLPINQPGAKLQNLVSEFEREK